MNQEPTALEPSAAQLVRQPGCARFVPGTPVSGQALLFVHNYRLEPVENPAGLELLTGEWVVFSDQSGEDLGCVVAPFEVEPDPELRLAAIQRKARPAELRLRRVNQHRAEDALSKFRHLVREYHLPMKPVAAHLRLDRHEIQFFFVSEERLNFRALHRAISHQLNLKVVIRQVGVRDYCRVQGGIGPCGRFLCCASFLTELKPITLRMARQQSLFVEPAKISGMCGKLLCCLRFEEETYSDSLEQLPRVGSTVLTERGPARVVSTDVLTQRVVVDADGVQFAVALDEVRRE
ncbi:MAG: regulatory iron-sulfur-containing complex subunit RicT [candidate division WOR-3 bacterium]